jgi:hypothetical protein
LTTPFPHSAAKNVVDAPAPAAATLLWTPGLTRAHSKPAPCATRRNSPALVAPMTCSRLPGSTASAKNASPASAGAPAAVGSATHVAPPSSDRMGTTPR